MERRLAAIVLADVVGYSHLMGDDEAATLTAVAALRSSIIDPAAEARGGRLVKAMGDGFLLEFASAVDAVESAVEIQGRVAEMSGETKAAQSIELRIGINVGDIMVEDGDVFGDGVNVAARLEGLADPGGILLSQAAYDQVRDRVQYSFDDLGDRSLKNIARPVKVFRLAMGRPSKPRRPRLQGDFGDLQAVAVLPFDNLSKDPAEDYFVEGLTEDIITALAYWRWFPVVARNSTFVYKGKPKNVTEIGRELGAAYLVEGSARRSGEQVRITVQLIEGATGHHLFAERYDRKIADVFIVQEEIAERIVASIEPEIHRAEARRASRKHPSDLSAWDHALKALSLQERMTPAGHAEARNHLKLALEIDPSSARAWSLLSLCRYHEGILGWVNRADALKSSLEAAEQAVLCDDREWLAQGLWVWGGCGPSATSSPLSMAWSRRLRSIRVLPWPGISLPASSNSRATRERRCRISKRFCAWTRTTASARLRSQIKVYATCCSTISARRFPPRRRPYGFSRETSGPGNELVAALSSARIERHGASGCDRAFAPAAGTRCRLHRRHLPFHVVP